MKMSGEMFEGKDYPTQWALNPAAYQNMNNDQVDWAALAQQWIKMKETSIPPAPPPPSIADELQCLSSNNGGGEAPMDMDTKDDDIPPAPPAPNISGTDGWNQWNQWGSHWNQNSTTSGNWEWNNSIPPGLDGKSVGISSVPSNVLIPPPAPTISSTSPPFPNHCNQSTPVQSTTAPPIPPTFGYSTMPMSQSQFSNQVSPNTFWNNEHPHTVAPGTTVPMQSTPFIKGLRQSSNRIPLVPPASTLTTAEMVTSRNREIRDRTPEDDFSSTLDTVKRRQLPAWIREGLEKMEREKQKAVERERQEILRKQELEARKKIEDQARAVLDPSRSKFDSDSEKETTEHEYDDDNKVSSNSNEDKQSPKDNSEQHSPDLMRPRKTRFRDAASPVVHSRIALTTHKEKSPDNTSISVASSLQQNKEEMLQNLMLKVRRSLTEILLEVTNDEISSVCKEVWKRYCSKAPAGQTLITSSNNAAPVSQITRKLGLGIYGDSNSESDEEHVSNHEHSQQSPGDNDSEEELKETLRRRQQAFRKTEAEIEARLAEEEEEEEDEDRVKVKRSGEHDEAENLRKRMEGSWRDDQSSREKDIRNEGSGRGAERRLRKDSGMGNTSSFKAVDSEIDTIYGNERKSSEAQSSISKGSSLKSTVADNVRIADGNVSSSSESADHYNSSKRTACSSKSKSSKSSSRKKLSRYGENAKDGSSSRSRSRSRNKYSSREGSCGSSRSSGKPEIASTLVSRTSGDGIGIDSGNASSSRNRASNKRVRNNMRKSTEKQYFKSKSRSTSRSDNNRSRSRSRSHSRSTSRSRSNRTKRSRSRSDSRRRRRSRARQRSRSRPRTRTRSRSRSHYRSRSRRRSRSSYSHRSSGTSKKRDTRSRSLERSRRSRSNTRSSKSHYYRQRHHYRQDRDGQPISLPLFSMALTTEIKSRIISSH